MSTVSLLAVSMTIGTPDSARIALQTSMPFIPGSIRSSSTRSGLNSRSAGIAREPSATTAVSKPSPRSTIVSISARAGSSSTTRTRAFIPHIVAFRPRPARCGDPVISGTLGRSDHVFGHLAATLFRRTHPPRSLTAFTPRVDVTEYARASSSSERLVGRRPCRSRPSTTCHGASQSAVGELVVDQGAAGLQAAVGLEAVALPARARCAPGARRVRRRRRRARAAADAGRGRAGRTGRSPVRASQRDELAVRVLAQPGGAVRGVGGDVAVDQQDVVFGGRSAISASRAPSRSSA